jgi:beta-glucosidase
MRVSTWMLTGALVALAGNGSAAAPEAGATDAQVKARVDALLARMTLEEKVGQLEQISGAPFMPGTKPPEATIRAGGAGSILWLNDTKKFNALQKVAVEESRLKIPLLFGLDVIHGYRTIFPVPLAMAASWDPALYERVDAIAAKEARAAGIHWTFAPMVDIARDARWGRIVEGAGEDPYLGAAMAAAQVRGFQGPKLGTPDRLLACAKHFAGYGAADGGRDYDPSYLSDTQLYNVYLPPFKAAVDAGVGSFMSAYMDLNNVPAAGNKWLLTDVLRGQWGFRGFVVSDAFAVGNLAIQHFARDRKDAALRALTAGNDMEMASGAYPEHLAALVKEGKVTTAQIDTAVRRVLEIKARMGLFENPYADEAKAAQVVGAPEYREASRLAAQRTMVLLRNEGKTLPLSTSLKSVAVIGPLADSKTATEGSWMVFGHEPAATTVLEGLKAKLPGATITFEPGPEIRRLFPSMFDAFTPGPKKPAQTPADSDAAFAKAVDAAKAADLVIAVMGELDNMAGEAASRASLDLPGRQEELLKAVVALGKPVVLVLLNGRPLSINWAAEHVPAILEAWEPGTEGGHAVADVLFGDVNPGGKLPVGFPRSAAQEPLYYARTMTHQPEGRQALGFTSPSRYWDILTTPLFPFGYGLSYTTFSYANLKPSASQVKVGKKVGVSVDVTNTGSVDGDEVVQLYVHQRAGSDSRPRRELKGFRRVSLKPGETQTVTFTLGPDELRYWSTSQRKWVQDAEAFDLWAGGDSNASLHAELAVVPAAVAAATMPAAPKVQTASGPVVGAVANGVASWKGIPFAAPPVGDLRWRAPQPAAPWTSPRPATEYGHDCAQLPFPSDAAPLGTPPAEDCLYLNVWAPETRTAKKLPVMFWIHGGGFVNGGSSPAVYDGSAFARRGVVFVSANYRLGRFGFFAHPALTKESPKGPLGNYGYLDQIAALQWIQKNVAAFGGDPGNVTIFGESAGGGSVLTLMTSPLSRHGLFHKAIVESGGGRAGGIMTPKALKDAESVGLAFAKAKGVEGEDAAALAALRKLPEAEVVMGLNMMSMGPQASTYSGPMVDGQVVTAEPETVIRDGQQAKVPLVIGANAREFGFMPLPPAAVDGMLARFGADKDKVVAAYDPEGKGEMGEVGVGIASDGAMVEPARLVARLTSAAGQPTYEYRFSYVASSLRATVKGALHATEIPFVFETVRAKYEDETTPEDEAIAAAANAYWVAFAKTGDPNTNGLPSWPRYSEKDDVLMDFAIGGPEAKADPWKARLDLVEQAATAQAARGR